MVYRRTTWKNYKHDPESKDEWCTCGGYPSRMYRESRVLYVREGIDGPRSSTYARPTRKYKWVNIGEMCLTCKGIRLLHPEAPEKSADPSPAPG